LAPARTDDFEARLAQSVQAAYDDCDREGVPLPQTCARSRVVFVRLMVVPQHFGGAEGILAVTARKSDKPIDV
jgi:hypothetical protein